MEWIVTADSTDTVTAGELIAAALCGEQRAWPALLARFLPLVRAIARSHRLGSSDVDDVAQTVSLRLVEYLDRIRDPAALPGWVAVTARHESLRLIKAQRRSVLVDHFDDRPDDRGPGQHDPDTGMLRAELATAVQAGLAQLPARQRDLLVLLSDGQPRSYREVGDLLDMPVGSIGPTRARGLSRLRETPSMRDYLDDCVDPCPEAA